ncbi:STAS domain-containing protein [Streptomyces sp. NPDC048248]|uniref:STAS domain-containing protein n=1 Tax=Streptomyces sp. NPDC048248 TaxID=3365523 RepID=UPI0037198713
MPTPYEPPEPGTGHVRPPAGEHPALRPAGPSIPAAEIPALHRRLRALLRDHPPAAVLCDVRALVAPDTSTVEALLRLQLTARRHGHHLRLRHVPEALGLLLALTGLSEALPADATDATDAADR